MGKRLGRSGVIAEKNGAIIIVKWLYRIENFRTRCVLWWARYNRKRASDNTTWTVSKYGVFSRPYFPVFGLNIEKYSISLRSQFKCGKYLQCKSNVIKIMVIIFSDLDILYKMFFHYKWNWEWLLGKNGIHELTHALPNDLRLRILRNEKISRKS